MMTFKQFLIESAVDFDENFLRSVARDQGVDLSGQSTSELKRMHEEILRQAMEYIDDPDMGMSPDNIGQEYYDVAKQYFGG